MDGGTVLNIAERVRRGYKHVGVDMNMYWNATRFLWRVFTHPSNPRSLSRVATSVVPDGYAPQSRFGGAGLSKDKRALDTA